jgi:hypothetical protein
MTDKPKRPQRLPNGQFAPGWRGGPGRPSRDSGRPTKAEVKRQRQIIAAWRAGGESLVVQMSAVLTGPRCLHCGKPMALTGWRHQREFCSSACGVAAEKARRTPCRFRMIEQVRARRAALRPAGQ